MNFNTCVTQPSVSGNRPPSTPPPTKETKTITSAIAAGQDLASLVDTLTPEMIQEYVLKRGYATELAKQVRLNPGAVKGRIPVMRNMLEWLYDPQAPTNLRNFFTVSKRKGGNLINTLPIFSNNWALDSSRLNLTSQVHKLSQGFDAILRRKGITDRATMDEVFVRMVEEGTDVYARQLGGGKMLDEYIARHQKNFHAWLDGKGIDGETALQLKDMAKGYLAAEEMARKVANESGLGVGRERGIGFIHRSMTPEARRILKERKLTWLESAYKNTGILQGGNTTKGRAAYDFIPEDQLKMADALGFKMLDGTSVQRHRNMIDAQAKKVAEYAEKMLESDPQYQVKYNQKLEKWQKYQKELAAGKPGYSQNGYQKLTGSLIKARKQVGKHSPSYNQKTLDGMYTKLGQLEAEYEFNLQQPLVELAEVLDDEGRLLQEVVQGLSDEKLNRLVDEGIMHKVPMTSVRLMDYMVDRYDLPFESLRELMTTNPAKAYEHYVEQLHEGLKNSNMTHSVVRGAAEEGWGVSRSAYIADPESYGQYVSLGEVLANTPFDVKKMGFDRPKDLDNLFVHPDVANQYVANLDLSRNAAGVHSMVKTIHQLSKTSMLTSASFVVKNMYGAMVSGWQAGMNVTAFPHTVSQLTRVAADGGALDSLDNTVRRYGGLTERELYLEATSYGLVDGSNLMGEVVQGDIRNALNLPESASNRLRYIQAQISNGRPLRAVPRVLEATQDVFSNMLSPLLFTTTMLEDSAKFTALKTALDGSSMSRFASVMSGSRFKGGTVQEALTHVSRYFVDFSDTNKVDTFLRSTIFPFWMYTSRNLPLQLRYAMRNPGRFMAYYRLASLMNEQARAAGDAFPESGANPWDADGMPLYFKQGDQWLRMGRETFDPMLEAVSVATRTFEDSSYQQVVERELGTRTTGEELINYFTGQTYGTVKSAVAAFTQEDPFSGIPLRSEDSFLGIEMPSIGGMPAGLTRFVLENNLPFVRQLNRNNPGGVFGVREMRDTHGRIVRESRRAFFGTGAMRHDRDPFIEGKDYEVPALLRHSRWMGLVQGLDVVKNVQNSHDFYLRSTKEFSKKANDLYEDYQQEVDPNEQERLLSEYFATTAMAEQMGVDANLTSLWLTQRGEITGAERRDQTDLLRSLQAEVDRRFTP